MEQLAEILLSGSKTLGVALEQGQLAALEQHLLVLAKWNAKLNLVGPGDVATWATQHTLDSLAIAPWISDGDSVVDIGSGAGFPGVPCAIARPDARFILVEPRVNRAAFLQNVLGATGIKNAKVRNERADAIADRFQLVVGRAVAAPLVWAEMAAGLCAPGGGFVLFALQDPPMDLGSSRRALVRRYELEGDHRFVAKYVPRET